MINVTVINASHTDRMFGNTGLTYRHIISSYFHNKYTASQCQCRRFKERAVRLVFVYTDYFAYKIWTHLPIVHQGQTLRRRVVNPLNAELNPICHLLALLGAHHFLHVSRIRVKSLTLKLLMSYIYIYIWITYS